MKISLCYIVKNEVVNLRLSLQSAAKSADEIIVTDTGSTDATKVVAGKFSARIYDFIWGDDFAAARNFTLSKATGDVVIFLDADEYFAYPEKVRAYIENSLRGEWECMAVPLFNIECSDKAVPLTEGKKEYVIRVWRNGKHFRYYGRVHETLYKQEPQGGLFLPRLKKAADDLLIMHTGYSEGIYPAKLRYYLSLLQQEVKEEGIKPLTYRYLADCYYGLQAYGETVNYVKKALVYEKKHGIETIAGRCKLYLYWLEAALQLKAGEEEILYIAKTGMHDKAGEDKEGSLQGVLWRIAIKNKQRKLLYFLLVREAKYTALAQLLIDIDQGHDRAHDSYTEIKKKWIYELLATLMIWTEGRQYGVQDYESCQKLLPVSLATILKVYYGEKTTDKVSVNTEADQALRRLLPCTAYSRYLAVCYDEIRAEEETLAIHRADDSLRQLQKNLYDEKSLLKFMSLLTVLQVDVAEEIEILNNLYDSSAVSFLANALGPGWGKLYIYYARRAGYPQNDVSAYLASGHPEAAAAELLLQDEILRQIKGETVQVMNHEAESNQS